MMHAADGGARSGEVHVRSAKSGQPIQRSGRLGVTMRVLVVDDILVNVILLAERLKIASYQVVTATSGEEALQIIRHSPPDIVLLDVMMPGMSGYDVCRSIRREEKSACLPVVMVTALDKDSDRDDGLDAGADEFLTKPVEDDVLFSAMHRATRKRSQQ